MKINLDIVRATYAFLAETPPFNKWNLPDAEDVKFVIFKDKSMYGYYQRLKRGKEHVIGVNGSIYNTSVLIRTMGHEMIHLHQGHTNMERMRGQHSAAFHVLAAQVGKEHGFDPMEI